MATRARRVNPRTRNPRGQGERLREALIDAAIELLGDLQDVDALSVRAVTSRAGVTPTALYLHFADKDELLAAVKERCFGELRRYALAAEQAAAPEPRAQAEQMCLAYLRFAVELPGHYRVLFHTSRTPTDIEITASARIEDRGWPPNASESFEDLVRAVRRCLSDPEEAFQIATMVWAALHGFATLRQTMRHFPLPSAEDYVRRLLDAYVGRP